MPIMWALADPKLGEREVLAAMLEVETDVVASHEDILLITGKGFAGQDFEQLLGATVGIRSRCEVQFRRSPGVSWRVLYWCGQNGAIGAAEMARRLELAGGPGLGWREP